MPFRDRSEAGLRLADALARFGDAQPVVLALPRGGVPVAAEIARALGAPLDLILVRKIGLPTQPELAMGAVVDGDPPLVVRNDAVIRMARVSEAEFQAACARELAEIERRRQRYLAGRARVAVAGRTAIVVDDGVATGATTRAALRAVRAGNPQRLVLAVPVAPTELLAAMREEADEVVCLEDHRQFDAIGRFYTDFRQITDGEVIAALARFPPDAPPTHVPRLSAGSSGDRQFGRRPPRPGDGILCYHRCRHRPRCPKPDRCCCPMVIFPAVRSLPNRPAFRPCSGSGAESS